MLVRTQIKSLGRQDKKSNFEAFSVGRYYDLCGEREMNYISTTRYRMKLKQTTENCQESLV